MICETASDGGARYSVAAAFSSNAYPTAIA
jgi:hypothetical protein